MPVCGWLVVFDVQRIALPKLIIKSQPEFSSNPSLFSIRKIIFQVFFSSAFLKAFQGFHKIFGLFLAISFRYNNH